MPELALVIILGYCSLPAQECSAVLVTPPTPFVSIDECRTKAKEINASKEETEKFMGVAEFPPPWDTYAKCGTREQFMDIVQSLGGVNVAQ